MRDGAPRSPGGARVIWPALPHNPFRKNGEADVEDGLIVVEMDFDGNAYRRVVKIEVAPG